MNNKLIKVYATCLGAFGGIYTAIALWNVKTIYANWQNWSSYEVNAETIFFLVLFYSLAFLPPLVALASSTLLMRTGKINLWLAIPAAILLALSPLSGKLLLVIGLFGYVYYKFVPSKVT